MSKEELVERVKRNHRHYPPQTEEKVKRHERVRAITQLCAMDLVSLCPEGRELSLALTALEEAMMWANAAIARGQEYQQQAEPPRPILR